MRGASFCCPAIQRVSSPENVAFLARQGIVIAIQSGFEWQVPKRRLMLFEPAIAMVNGLRPERALQPLMLDAAKFPGRSAGGFT